MDASESTVLPHPFCSVTFLTKLLWITVSEAVEGAELML